jgi:protein-S-isoprenylcysteine O-methyltransferase Ste14
MNRRKGPGGPIPPTLVYAAGFLAAWWLDTQRRFLIDGAGASPVQLVLGAVAFAVGVWLFAWGLSTFARERTGIMLQQAVSHVVEKGPYRFTRNPMYVGFTASYFGLALLVNAAWPIVLLPVVLIVLTLAVIRREERYMQSHFGPAYDEYCQRVRRWL